MKNQITVLTYNFVSIPMITKNLPSRLNKLRQELTEIQPDIICFQELWFGFVKKRLINTLTPLGYNYYSPRFKLQANGLITFTKGNIATSSNHQLKPTFNGINMLVYETFGFKGYLLTQIRFAPKKEVYVFNVHLNANWGDRYDKDSKYSQIQQNALSMLARHINSIENQPIIVAGDLNVQPHINWYQDFIKNTGLKGYLPDKLETVLPTLFKFHMPHGGKTDYILVKNIGHKNATSKLIWDAPLQDVGQLSDHVGILTTINL